AKHPRSDPTTPNRLHPPKDTRATVILGLERCRPRRMAERQNRKPGIENEQPENKIERGHARRRHVDGIDGDHQDRSADDHPRPETANRSAGGIDRDADRGIEEDVDEPNDRKDAPDQSQRESEVACIVVGEIDAQRGRERGARMWGARKEGKLPEAKRPTLSMGRSRIHPVSLLAGVVVSVPALVQFFFRTSRNRISSSPGEPTKTTCGNPPKSAHSLFAGLRLRHRRLTAAWCSQRGLCTRFQGLTNFAVTFLVEAIAEHGETAEEDAGNRRNKIKRLQTPHRRRRVRGALRRLESEE